MNSVTLSSLLLVLPVVVVVVKFPQIAFQRVKQGGQYAD